MLSGFVSFVCDPASASWVVFVPIATPSSSAGRLPSTVLHLFCSSASTPLSFRVLFSSLHRGPQMIAAHQNELSNNHTATIRVLVQPLPIWLSNGTTAATPPAPSKHRTKLLAALAAAELTGLQSMISTFMLWKDPDSMKVLKKRRTSAAGRGGCSRLMTQP